jgi:uncharacterized protein (DUF488 family)
MSKPIIFTIGHSNHPIDYFLDLLTHYRVNCVVDVRSMPASRFNPQYNKKSLAESLKNNGIEYLHFGEAFGARQTDRDLLDDEGFVDFEKVRSTKKFQDAVKRLVSGVENGYTIALMCSEAEPLSCHRFVMISVVLKEFEIRHILKDRSWVSQPELEIQLLDVFSKKISAPGFFDKKVDGDERLRAAYRMMNKKMAYKP